MRERVGKVLQRNLPLNWALKGWVGILQIKGKGKKKSNSGKGKCKTVFCVQGTESSLVEMEVTVDKEGGGGREDPTRAEAC